VLRPGGVDLTKWLLDALAVGRRDSVVEFNPGLGATARLALARRPESFVAVGRDSATLAAVSTLKAPTVRVRGQLADAVRTGLPDGSASVVYGEAMLTMQPERTRRRVVAEAYRLLRSSGRYGIHELCLTPDDIEPALAQEITAALGDAIDMGAPPRTVSGWRELLAGQGFTVIAEATVPMRLLEPSRLIADEGLSGAVRIAARLLRDTAARRQFLQMRGALRRYRRHLGAVALVAIRGDRPSTDLEGEVDG
jgi:SAM-dependent methyltransferase